MLTAGPIYDLGDRRVNHTRAKAILFDEAAAARSGDTTSLVEAWRARLVQLGELCPHGRSSTVIAALGTAILAKATDGSVDVYALLDRGEAARSYSARSLADNVWARHRAELGIDIGANGANPLNNTPFIGKTRIDEITGVRNKAGWSAFIECMEALQQLKSPDEARQALRGFILARSRSLLIALEISPQEGDDLTQSGLVAIIDRFVAEDSEGGRRAQAVVAGMLDAAYGEKHVVVGVINDPDRHAPLDVSVTGDQNVFIVAFEVKDKPVSEYHVRLTVEKTVKGHALRNLAFVAVSKQQQTRDFDPIVLWAARHGVKLTMFLDWSTLFAACKCFAPALNDLFEGRVFRRLLARAAVLGVAPMALEDLRATAKAAGSESPT